MMAIFTLPLKVALVSRASAENEPPSRTIYLTLALYASLTALFYAVFALDLIHRYMGWNDSNGVDAYTRRVREFVGHFGFVGAHQWGLMFLISLSLAIGKSKYLVYVVILFVYPPRVYMPFEQVGFLHMCQIYVLGLVMSKHRMRECSYSRVIQFQRLLAYSYYRAFHVTFDSL